MVRKNQIRAVLTKFFSDRDCHVMFRPISDEKKLRNIENVAYESLKPQFRYQMEDLISKIFTRVKPKSINGQCLNGKMFCDLADAYV